MPSRANELESMDDDRVGDDQSVHRSRPHGRRRVDEDDIEVGQNRLQLPAQEKLAIDLLSSNRSSASMSMELGKSFNCGRISMR